MVACSWQALPISSDGPLPTLYEIFFFVSRAGYADIDHSVSAGWLGRIRFFEFFGRELLRQVAFVGPLLGVAGLGVAWAIPGRRGGAFLAGAFPVSSAGPAL